MSRPTARAALFLLAVALPACAVGTDEAPRDIEQGTVVIRDASDAQAAVGAGRIYLTVPGVSGEPTRLRSVARDVGGDDPDTVMAALLAGPNTGEFSDQLRTAIPETLEVLSLQRRAGGVIDLDVTDEIQQLTGDAQVLALAQITYTMSELAGVESVRLTVDGESVQWPDGTGELTVDPLTVYDFPGLEPSAQPPFPAVPSNEPSDTTPTTSTTEG